MQKNYCSFTKTAIKKGIPIMPRTKNAIPKNVTVNYDEGLFYVDYKDIYMYHEIANPDHFLPESQIPAGEEDKYEFDEEKTQIHYDSFKARLSAYLCQHLPSLKVPPEDMARNRTYTKRILAENNLFQIALEDNNWSVAVKLLRQKDGNTGLQTQMYNSFLNRVRLGLFQQFKTLYVRDGAWSASKLTKSMPATTGNLYINPDQIFASDEVK